MPTFTIKTFDLSAGFETVQKEAQHIIVSETDIDFIKSYWYYALFGDQTEPTKLRGNHTVNMLYATDNDLPTPSALAVLHTFDKTVNIELLVVSQECRGCGFGTSLLNDIIARNAAKKITLEVHADNVGAIRLYKKYEFKLVDLCGDYLCMARKPKVRRHKRPIIVAPLQEQMLQGQVVLPELTLLAALH